MSELFRHQVVDRVSVPFGQAVSWSPPHLRGLLAGLLLVSMCLAAYILTRDYTWKEPVRGTTQAVHPPVSVKAAVPGVVAQLFVAVGSQVDRGQKLATLNTQVYDQNGVSQVAHRLSEARAQFAMAQAEQSMVRRVRNQQQHALEEQYKSLAVQVGLAESQHGVLAELVASAKASYLKRKRLSERRLIAESELLASYHRWLEAQRAVLENRRTQADMSQQLTRVKQALAHQAVQADLQEVQYQGRFEVLAQNLEVIESSHHQLLVAPLAGVIGDIAGAVGTHLSAGAGLFTINPTGRQSHVELWLSSHARGRVSVGQRVYLRISGYPQQEFGLAEGEVDLISTISRGLESDVPLFRARVVLTRLPAGVQELPTGMQVEGDIELATLPIWQWLLRPAVEFWSRT